jgi:hypothetical protein
VLPTAAAAQPMQPAAATQTALTNVSIERGGEEEEEEKEEE